MKKLLIVIAIGVLIVLMSCQINFQERNINIEKPVFGEVDGFKYFEGRLIVGYENREAVNKIIEVLDAKVTVEIPQIKAVGLKFDGKVKDALNKLKKMKLDGIRYVEPSYVREIPEPTVVDDELLKLTVTGCDEEFAPYLWGLWKVNALDAWEEATGTGIIIAVVDTAIDGQHPDLIGQFVTGYDPELGVEIPPDTDYQDPDNPSDDHGTHVAGTIAAKRDGTGVVGLAYGAKIMPIVIFKGINGSSYYVGDEFTAAGIVWAVDHGADVLSNSWGGWGYSHTLKEAIDYALKKGAIFVASAGNDHTDQHFHYPSAYPGVIAVAASTARDEIIDFSSRGDYISVSAPGVRILSCIPRGSAESEGIYERPYAYWSGTSMAAPHVSALVALLKQKYPDATPYQIKKMIEKGAVDIEDPGFDHSSGYGRIDAKASLDKNPSDYTGATLNVEVKASGGWGVSRAYVTLKRVSGDGSYYAKTDDNGVARFYNIDPGEYIMIVGGPDWLDLSAPNRRMEEELSVTNPITLESGEATETIIFDSECSISLTITPNQSAMFYVIDAFTFYPVAIYSFDNGHLSADLSHLSGLYYFKVTRDSTDSTATISGTVFINGDAISVNGTIYEGEDSCFVDEYGGRGFWWTIF